MNPSEPSLEIPIFLRKTYALVDTCSKEAPSICSWTDSGATFTIFDPELFEQKQIPLYFKHSKFSSFVRQLNFYSFRKIKEDAIRIDLDASNQNHWKFRHELFQQGQPQRMAEMKRMASKSTKPKTVVPTTCAVATPPKESNSAEVTELKQRIEEMNKNIDVLTQMVQKVSLKQEKVTVETGVVEAGTKRKKLERSGSSMKIEEEDEFDLPSFPEQVPSLPDTVKSSTSPSFSEQDDDAFVEELFQAFNEDEAPFPDDSMSSMEMHTPSNRPDPELMQKLGDCLEMLPKPIQEMIVNRLIEAITEGLEEVESQTTLAALVCDGAKKLKAAIPVIPVHA